MISKGQIAFIIIILCSLICCSRSNKKSTIQKSELNVRAGNPKDPSELENKIIDDFIRNGNADWRRARLDDNRADNLSEYISGNPGYNPYFLEADLTQDSINDFVIVLVKEKDFGIVWFHGKKDGSYSSQWLTKSGDLSKGGLFLRGSDLLVGGCFYCDNDVLFVWDKKTNSMVMKK